MNKINVLPIELAVASDFNGKKMGLNGFRFALFILAVQRAAAQCSCASSFDDSERKPSEENDARPTAKRTKLDHAYSL